MTKPARVWETYKNSQGQYECRCVRQSSAEPDAEPEFWQQHAETDDACSDSGDTEQAFYINPDLARAVSPDWAVQAQQIFMQSLHSNFQGGHADYLKQMRIQFELMHQTLQQQMAQFSQKN